MKYKFTETEKNKLIAHTGEWFYLQVVQAVDMFSEKWKLSELSFNENYSVSPIFFCRSERYGDCVLKIYDDDEIESEYNILRQYDGEFYVRAFEYGNIDKAIGAMLIERAVPGEPLRNEPYLEKRLAVFSELFNGRHGEHAVRLEPKKLELYSSCKNWITGTLDDMISKREDNEELYAHALKAKEIYLEMASVYDRKLILHTDLHPGNIISCGNGKYKIIDINWAVIGDPVFEAGLFFAEECKESERTEIVLDYLEKSLNIPNKFLRQCFYITVVMNRWSGIDKIKFAENVMNKGVEK